MRLPHRCAGVALVLVGFGAGCQDPPEPLPLAAEPPPADLGARAYAHVAAVVAMGERHPGSPGARQQIDYIAAALRTVGIEVRLDVWTDPREGLTFTNVIGVLPGPRPERLLIGCHHDTKRCNGHPAALHNFAFVGANDGGSGVGLTLALAESLARQPHRELTCEFVFFDGEESQEFHWNPARSLFGARRYVAQEREPGRGRHWTAPIRALLLLDMVGAADLQLDDDGNSDARMKRILAAAAERAGHGQLVFKHRNTVTDDHLPFLDAGIPAAVLIDLHDNPEWHTPKDTLERVAAASLQKVGEIVWTALPALRALALRTAK